MSACVSLVRRDIEARGGKVVSVEGLEPEPPGEEGAIY